jgi:hypothetical protein
MQRRRSAKPSPMSKCQARSIEFCSSTLMSYLRGGNAGVRNNFFYFFDGKSLTAQLPVSRAVSLAASKLDTDLRAKSSCRMREKTSEFQSMNRCCFSLFTSRCVCHRLPCWCHIRSCYCHGYACQLISGSGTTVAIATC